jgi:hypothetical protein
MERLPRLGFSLVAGVGLLAGGLASFASVSAHTTPSNSALTAAGSYVSVTPYRVADTRTSSPLAGAATLNVQVAETVAGTVPVGAAAAVLNVTAVDPTAAGFLTVFPAGTTMPTVSNLNFAAGTIVPNLVTVGLSATGAVSIYLNTGSTNVVVDVEGYYTSTVTTSGLYNPINPVRVFGTLPIGTAIGAGATTAVTVAGTSATDGVPASASAVVLNVTAAHATAPSFLTVFPAGVTMPTASNLNFGAQAPLQAIANRVTVGVGTSGQIDVYNLQGTVAVDVDVDGYYASTGSPFVAITPIRVADTRTATKVGSETAIAAATTEAFTLATPDIPANAAGVAMNLTVVPGAAPGYLTSYPTSATTPPVASDVNWTASESPAVPNFTIANTAGTGIAQNVDVANSYFTTGATVDVIADAFGYFGASTATVVPPSSYYAITVHASPSTIPANGSSTSSVSATVTGQNTAPVANDEVMFTLTGTGCGAFTSPTAGNPVYAITGSSGTTPAQTYTSSTAAGTCTVSVQEANQGTTNSTVITQTPVGYQVVLTANPASYTLNGYPTSGTLTATVTFGGAAVSGDPVTFTLAPDTAGACGTYPTTIVIPTNASGQAIENYLNTATAVGFCQVGATEANHAVGTAYITENSGQSTANKVAVTAYPTAIPADSHSTSIVTATVTGATDSAVYPDYLMFQWSGDCGIPSGTTFDTTIGPSGSATQSYTASGTPGTCSVTVTEANSAATGSTTITQNPVVYSVAVTATPPTITGNGITTSAIAATVKDTSGNTASGVTVTFAVAPSNGTSTCGTLSASHAITDGSGVASVTYISSVNAGFCTVTATETVTHQPGTVQIDQTSV